MKREEAAIKFAPGQKAYAAYSNSNYYIDITEFIDLPGKPWKVKGRVLEVLITLPPDKPAPYGAILEFSGRMVSEPLGEPDDTDGSEDNYWQSLARAKEYNRNIERTIPTIRY